MLDRKLDDKKGRGKKSPEFGEFKIQHQRLSDFRKLAEIPMPEFKGKIEEVKAKSGSWCRRSRGKGQICNLSKLRTS